MGELVAHRLQSWIEFAQCNYDDGDEYTKEDAMEEAMGECGMLEDGDCLLAGSEYCDWDCPWNGWERGS